VVRPVPARKSFLAATTQNLATCFLSPTACLSRLAARIPNPSSLSTVDRACRAKATSSSHWRLWFRRASQRTGRHNPYKRSSGWNLGQPQPCSRAWNASSLRWRRGFAVGSASVTQVQFCVIDHRSWFIPAPIWQILAGLAGWQVRDRPSLPGMHNLA
jgi:hypothetical protein